MKTASGFDTFRSYWSDLRSGQPLPLKQDFSPADVRSLLSQMSVFEIKSNENLYVRLIGTSLFEQGKASQTGTNQFDIIDPDQKTLMSRVLDDLLLNPCLVGFTTDRFYRSGQVVSTVGNAFPFLDGNGEARFMIVVFEADKAALNRIEPDDEVVSVKYTQIEFEDVGNGVPDWSFVANDQSDETYAWQEEPFVEFIDYWRSLVDKGEKFPKRSNFNPMRLPKLLPHLWVAERVGEEVLSRLIGTALTDRESMHLDNGASFRELAAPDYYERFLEVLKVCEAEQRTCYVTTKRNLGEDAQRYHMLLLPFQKEDDERQQFIALELPRPGGIEMAEPSDYPVYDIKYTILDIDQRPVDVRQFL